MKVIKHLHGFISIEDIKRKEISSTQKFIIAILNNNDVGLENKEIATILNKSIKTITTLTKDLISKGFLKRSQDEN